MVWSQLRRIEKRLVNEHVLDKSYPRKHTQAGSDVPSEKVPEERSTEAVQEPPVSRDRPAVCFVRIRAGVIMKCIHESAIHQLGRPNHRCGLHQQSAEHTCDTKACHLSRDRKQNGETPAHVVQDCDLTITTVIGSAYINQEATHRVSLPQKAAMSSHLADDPCVMLTLSRGSNGP